MIRFFRPSLRFAQLYLNRILVTYQKRYQPSLSYGLVEWLLCQELLAFAEFAV